MSQQVINIISDMDNELRKRLEEAAYKIKCDIVDEDTQEIYCNAIEKGAMRGIEHGYREAVKEAIKWWNNELFDNYHNAKAYTEKHITKEELFEFFEKEMLKLLEEK